MIKLSQLKIYIVTIDEEVYESLKNVFNGLKNVNIVNDDIRTFYDKKSDEIDCLVSPGNAYGCMTGGYDAALLDILDYDFQFKVQEYIEKHYYGEQPVATSFIIDTDISGLRLIHTPTMQYPSPIDDNMVVYQSMRTTLMCALKHDVNCIVIPAFGTSVGEVDGETAAYLMLDAYMQIKNRIGAKYVF